MLPNRELWGGYRRPQGWPLTRHWAFCPVLGDRGMSRDAPNLVPRAWLPSLPGQVAPSLGSSQKKDSLYSPRKFVRLFQTHSSRPDEERGGGRVSGPSPGQTPRSTLGPPHLPPSRKGLGPITLQPPNRHPERARDPPRISPQARRKTGPLAVPTENSHFFAARFQKHAGFDAIRRIM